MKNSIMQHVTIKLLLLVILSFSYSLANANGHFYSRFSDLSFGGHEKVILFMANGDFDPNDEDFVAPDFDFFANEVMKWSEAERLQFEESARSFFETRFGVDVDSPEFSGRATLVPFMLDPRWEYRMYWASDEFTPRKGRVIRDGGFQLVVLDPNGIELGGDFEGVHVPQGSAAAFGIYNVKSPFRYKRDLILPYQSRQPVLQNNGFPLTFGEEGVLVAPFTVEHPVFGDGWAFAHIWASTSERNLPQANIRNVLTFSKGATFPSR